MGTAPSYYAPSLIDPVLQNDEADGIFWKQHHKSSNLSPEQHLAFAVLHDAIRCYQLAPSTNRKRNLLQIQARDWVASNSEHPYSFQWCCEALGIDAGECRGKIQLLIDIPRHRRTVAHPQRMRIGRKEA